MEKNIRKKQIDEEIANLQNELIPIVNQMYDDNEIVFATALAEGASSGNHWKPIDSIDGDYIYKSISKDSDWVIETSKKVADDYQKVIAKYFEYSPKKQEDILEEGRNWLFGKLLMWSGSIVESALISHQEIIELASLFDLSSRINCNTHIK